VADVEMTAIPGGRMPAGPARGVVVAPFALGVFAVTEEQLGEMLGERRGDTPPHPRRPATDLSWLRAVRFCNALSEWEGLHPVYRFDGEDVTRMQDADGFRLPTETEWEFACRAGSSAPRYGALPEIGWSSADGVRHPQDVGARLPNLFGLFDTLGNVWEWCDDVFDPDSGRRARALRGGGFADEPTLVRADVRREGDPRAGYVDVGFRVARDS
jgi:formylglycine-generating enzyme